MSVSVVGVYRSLEDLRLSEAHDLAIALRSGALLAPVYVMEKRSVGPSLGADSIKSSSMALVLGFVMVVFFMVLYYGMAGVIANVALDRKSFPCTCCDVTLWCNTYFARYGRYRTYCRYGSGCECYYH